VALVSVSAWTVKVKLDNSAAGSVAVTDRPAA
jgi:hypothetical protein